MNQTMNKATIGQAILDEAQGIRALLDNSASSEMQSLEMLIQMQSRILESLEQVLTRLECLRPPQTIPSLPV